MRMSENILQLIGKTPLVKLSKISARLNCNLVAKLESFNPGSSVKDRTALSLIESAEKRGVINRNTTLIVPTSGNTGIALAYICAVKGYSLIITMPESMSVERQKLLKAFGTKIYLTPADEGMEGSIKKAMELKEEIPNSYILDQFRDPSNPEIHEKTTAVEIWEDTEGQVDLVVAGIGTGGTITGVGRFLKKRKPSIKIIGVEPYYSPVISEGKKGKHKIQGIGAGFVPEVLDLKVVDEIVKVKDEDAFSMVRLLAREEGILCGISSGAVLQAAMEIIKRDKIRDKLVVLISPDSGERYLSTEIFDD